MHYKGLGIFILYKYVDTVEQRSFIFSRENLILLLKNKITISGNKEY